MKIDKSQLIYVVDDDQALNVMICTFLNRHGFNNVKGIYSGEELLNEIKSNNVPIIIQDFNLPGMNGIEVIKEIKEKYPDTEFVFLSGQSSIEVAVEAIRYGAFDYIIKDNFAKENVTTKIKNIIKIKQLEKERKSFKKVIAIAAVLIIISWIIMFFFYFDK